MSEENAKHEGAEAGHEGGHSGGGHGGGHGGHGGGAHEEHEGAPEWLISFADNVALLMGFFVILLAMNMKEPTTGGIGGKDGTGAPAGNSDTRMLDMILSIRSAFHNPVSVDSTAPEDAALVKRMKEKAKPSGKSSIEAPPGLKPEVQSVRPSDYKKLGGLVTFGEGSASLSAQATQTAADIAAKVRGKKWIIEVRGSASAQEAFKSVSDGYRLSYMRAFNVAEALRNAGIPWGQLRVVACGDRLVSLAYSKQEHAPNQRVEIVVTDDLAPDDPHASENVAAVKE